ncbi:MAG: TolC family protein [Acidobacteria bacterium]|nr:TolC family protein [Acidobacteriota bacterium]
MAAYLLCVLVNGCVHYQPRPIVADATLDDFEARSLDAPEIRRFLHDQVGVDQWPPSFWDLQSLTLAALYYSPDLDVARARWGVIQAGTITAGARPNPALNASLGYNSTSELIRPWIPEVVLGLPIETAGKRGLRISEAQTLSEAARLDVISAAWVVRSRLRHALVDLYRAQEIEAALLHLHELQVQSLNSLEAQLAVGAISANEVTLTRIATGRTRLAALEAARERERAWVELAAALGIPTTAVEGIEISFDEFERLTTDVPSDEMRRQAIVHRTDILSALAEYESTQVALQIEIAKQYPDIDIGAGYQLDQTDNKWTLGLNLVLPIFNRNRGPIAEADARRAEAAARFLALQSRVLAEVDGATVSYRSAVEAAAAADEILTKLRQREDSIQTAYGLGAASKLEVLSAEIEIATGCVARLEALVRAQRAAGDLENALQKPLDTAEWILVTPARAEGDTEAQDDE